MAKEVKKGVYTADFETTTDVNDCRVWAYAFYDINEDYIADMGNNIDSFFDFLAKKNSEVWFHNLKFDGMFLIYWLHTHGFEYSKEKVDRTFNTLITDSGQFYSIEVIFKKNKKVTHKAVFKDSLKKLPFPVAKIAKAFKLKESKLEIDYNEYRPIGHQLTLQEEEYLKNDVIIVGKALKTQFDKELTRLTVASDAMNFFKSTVNQEFKEYFPVLDIEIDDFIRKSYKGGWTYLNPKYANKMIDKGMVFDINSLYPSRMYDCVLPFGNPVFYQGEYEESRFFPCYIQRIRVDLDLKEGYLPTIQLKNNPSYSNTEYITSTHGDIEELVLTNVDLQLLFEHYNVNYIEYVDGYKFRGCKGMFANYIDYWMNVKIQSEIDGNESLRTLAKLMLNSLYGKFASNPRKTCKVPYLAEEDNVQFNLDEEEMTDAVYTAVASFITAHARYKTITSCQLNYVRFIYADTDSMHLEGVELPDNIYIHKTELGAWKHESDFTRGLFVRAKTYIEEIDGELHVKCAGMPDNLKIHVTFDNFKPGMTFCNKEFYDEQKDKKNLVLCKQGKLKPKSVKGGVVLVEEPYTIKA